MKITIFFRQRAGNIIRNLLYLGILISLVVSACQSESVVIEVPDSILLAEIPPGMSQAEAQTLASLEQIDGYPLYTMVYHADYSLPGEVDISSRTAVGQIEWACSLYTAYGNQTEMIFGRNFDWDYSPGLLLFTDPADGYASVSMVDIYYLGFGSEKSWGLAEIPLENRAALLDAPYLPFDGLNEAGLAVGMAAVPGSGYISDPENETIDSLMLIRLMLDQAGSIDEAVEIIRNYNIDWGSGPALHYLIADRSGRSVLVEFIRGDLRQIPNTESWQVATNFLLAEAGPDPENHCWRYDLISQELEKNQGNLTDQQALRLLNNAAQESTQWSVVYKTDPGEVLIFMGGNLTDSHRISINPEE
jgi:hypothetical protein